jgi:two-component system sensor histidine kinase VicK
LPLAIFHELVERHGGSIWVESKEGSGTTFYISLPMEKVPAATETQSTAGT